MSELLSELVSELLSDAAEVQLEVASHATHVYCPGRLLLPCTAVLTLARPLEPFWGPHSGELTLRPLVPLFPTPTLKFGGAPSPPAPVPFQFSTSLSPCRTAARTRSAPNVSVTSLHKMAIECFLGPWRGGASNGRSAKLDVPAIDNSSHCSQQVLSRFAMRPGQGRGGGRGHTVKHSHCVCGLTSGSKNPGNPACPYGPLRPSNEANCTLLMQPQLPQATGTVCPILSQRLPFH